MDSAIPQLRPLSVSDLIDETFQMYRRNFILFISITAVLIVPITLIEVLQQFAVQRQTSTTGMAEVGFISLLFTILRFLVYLGILSAIIHAAAEIRMGRQPTVMDSYLTGMDRFGSMIRVALLLLILLPLTFITIIGIPVAIYLAFAWLLAFHVAVIEGEGAWASLSRSRELVKRNWWRVLGITLLVGLIVSIVNLVFDIPALVVGIPVIMSQGSQLLSPTAVAVSNIFSAMGSIITGPIIYIAWLFLYYDLRARKEGLDLEMMSQRAQLESQQAVFRP